MRGKKSIHYRDRMQEAKNIIQGAKKERILSKKIDFSGQRYSERQREVSITGADSITQ